MTSILRVGPTIEVIELDEVRLQILGVGEAFTLTDERRYIRDLVAWCDGTRSEDEVRSLLMARLSDGNKLIDFLKARHILVEAQDCRPSDPLVDYIASAALPFASLRDERRRQTSLNMSSICLIGNGALASECHEAMSALGLNFVDKDADLTLALSDVMDHASMRELNRGAIANHDTILFASLDRFNIRVGALSGVMSTMYSSVEARGRDIATLRAIGFGQWAAFAGTIVEASTLATMGGMLGILFMLAVLHSSRISIVGGNVSQTIISLKLDAWIIVQGFNMAIAIGVLGGILPALASAKEDVAVTFGR
jgi:hypothetical protein